MRPRGIPSPWVKVAPWYYTRRDEPSRKAELDRALKDEYTANGEHDPVCEYETKWRGTDCPGEYLETCGDEGCCGCVPTHCPCSCHDGQCGCDYYTRRR